MEKRQELFNQEDDFEEDFCIIDNKNSYNDEEKQIYEFVDNLQQIVIEDEFSNLRNTFFEKYSGKFNKESDENSIESYQIFKEYVNKIEGFLTKELNQRIKNLNIDLVLGCLINRKDEELIDEELLEMLISFTDFCVFKDMMLDYQENKNSNLKMELSSLAGFKL